LTTNVGAVKPQLVAGPAKAKRWTSASITRGKKPMPVRILGYGVPGVGKTTFAAGAPDPVFLCSESGTQEFDVARLPSPETWDDVFDALAILDEPHDFKTLVVDTVNWLELLAWARLVEGPGAKWGGDTSAKLAKYEGGFNKGYDAVVSLWRVFVFELERHWKRGMNVILLAHSHVKGFNDPSGPGYDRYEVQMHHKAAGVLQQWCDFVLFMRHEVVAKKDDSRRNKGTETGARIIHTRWSAAFEAKARVKLPDEIPLSWSEFASAVGAAEGAVDELKARIGRLIEQIGDVDVTKKATGYVAAAKNDPDRLAEIANALTVKLGNKEK